MPWWVLLVEKRFRLVNRWLDCLRQARGHISCAEVCRKPGLIFKCSYTASHIHRHIRTEKCNVPVVFKYCEIYDKNKNPSFHTKPVTTVNSTLPPFAIRPVDISKPSRDVFFPSFASGAGNGTVLFMQGVSGYSLIHGLFWIFSRQCGSGWPVSETTGQTGTAASDKNTLNYGTCRMSRKRHIENFINDWPIFQ